MLPARLTWTTMVAVILCKNSEARVFTKDEALLDGLYYMYKAYRDCSSISWWKCFKLQFVGVLEHVVQSNSTEVNFGNVLIFKKCNFQNVALSKSYDNKDLIHVERNSSLASAFSKLLHNCYLEVSINLEK